MRLNYKEGMFLGKEELERQALFDQMMADSIGRVISNPYYRNHFGLFDLIKIGVSFTISNDKLLLHISPVAHAISGKIGRVIVGTDKNGDAIGLPCKGDGWALTNKDAQISNSGLSSQAYYLQISASTTNYENALMSINAQGTGTITVNPQILSMFRTGSLGRHSKIRTEGGQTLTINSINEGNATVQFEGDSFVVETNTRFMFVHTTSPFIESEVEPLYTYPSCTLSWSPTLPSDGLSFVVGTVEIETDGTYGEIIIEDFNSEPFYWRSVLMPKSVRNEHLSQGCVKGDSIAPNTITRDIISPFAYGYRTILQDQRVQQEILFVQPGSIITDYRNINNPENDRYIKPLTPAGWSLQYCMMQPALVIMTTELPYIESPSTIDKYFRSHDGVFFQLPTSMEGYVPDSEHICIFKFYWMSLTDVLVEFIKMDMNW